MPRTFRRGRRARASALAAATAAAAAIPGPAAWPEVRQGPNGEPRFAHQRGGHTGDEEVAAPRAGGDAPGAAFEADAQELLRRALAIADACDAELAGKGGEHGHLRVERAMDKPNCSVWLVQEDGQVAGTCSQAIMKTRVPLAAFLWSIYDVDERLTWDEASFVAYEVLSAATARPGEALADVIYCRMPAPTGMAERDVVQERFLLRLPQQAGFAIVMTSPSTAAASAHLQRNPLDTAVGRPAAVRATTALSGYLVRPLPGGDGVRITAMSQTDLGGSIPAWMQAAAKKAGTQRFVQWSERLRKHCETAGDLEGPSPRPAGTTGCIVAKQPLSFGGPSYLVGRKLGPEHIMILVVVAICAAVRIAASRWLVFGGN